MSADNWAICPRCEDRRLDEIRAAEVTAAEQYGKVPVEEWDALRAAADELKAAMPEHTFREDYEFYGVEDGELHVSYNGGCKVCGLTHTFKHSETMAARP